jgi:putative hemolysin
MHDGPQAFALVDRSGRWWQRCLGAALERGLGLDALREWKRQIDRRLGVPITKPTPAAWIGAACDWLRLDVDLPAGDLERIPSRGPALVAADHPTGAMEGVLLLAMLLRIRTDVKVLANRWLARLPAFEQLVIPVDVFGEHNTQALREALRHLRGGGMLLAFPAGEVARGRWLSRRPQEGRWQRSFAGLQRLADAPVVPVHVDARGPGWIERLGALHPLLRTALLPRALLHQRGGPVAVRCGHSIAPSQLERFGHDDRARADYLRLRTEILARRVSNTAPVAPAPRPLQSPLAVRGDVAQLSAEIAQLGADNLLLTANGMQVFCVRAKEAPAVLLEIGRLRELTFRGVGEGSGAERDLDRFDASYRHLFVWDAAAHEIVGSYRLGLSDELLAAGGDDALYTAGFYTFAQKFWQRLSPALELGRSFVQPRYQKGFAPLLLLWRGIGAFVTRNPRYRNLFGTVSISADHHATSVRLMVDYLRSHCLATDLAPLVRSKKPWAAAPHEQRSLRWLPQQIAELHDVSAMVRELEVHRAGVPVLLEQYLKLGAKLLGVNVDPAFQTIDALVVVDLLSAPSHLQQRYLGPDGMLALRHHHGDPSTAQAGCRAPRAGAGGDDAEDCTAE